MSAYAFEDVVLAKKLHLTRREIEIIRRAGMYPREFKDMLFTISSMRTHGLLNHKGDLTPAGREMFNRAFPEFMEAKRRQPHFVTEGAPNVPSIAQHGRRAKH